MKIHRFCRLQDLNGGFFNGKFFGEPHNASKFLTFSYPLHYLNPKDFAYSMNTEYRNTTVMPKPMLLEFKLCRS